MVMTTVPPDVRNLAPSKSWPPRMAEALDAITVIAFVPIPRPEYSVPTPIVGVTDPPTAEILIAIEPKSIEPCAVVGAMVIVSLDATAVFAVIVAPVIVVVKTESVVLAIVIPP